MTTLLVHIQKDSGHRERLEAALALARATGGHLHCLHVTPIEAYTAFEGLGGVFVLSGVIAAIKEQDDQIRVDLEAKLSGEDVGWDFTQVTGQVAQILLRHSALADLIVTGREPHPKGADLSVLPQLGDLLFGSRTPLYIPASEAVSGNSLATAAIAWDGSAEVANTVRQCVPLLRRAGAIEVLSATEDGKEQRFPGTQLLRYLSRHGIHANLQTLEVPKEVIGPVLAQRAMELGASYLLMGAYNHSRLGEYLFGGVTRTLLADSPLPLIIGR